MNLFKSIYIEPPFGEWGFYRTLSIPVWRIAAPDCNLVVRVYGKEVNLALECIKKWGFMFYALTPYFFQKQKDGYAIWAKQGDPPLPNWQKSKPIAILSKLPGPRLLMNVGWIRKGWQQWSIYGWPQIDPYAYPIRQNYVDVNFTIASLIQEAKEANEEGSLWRFRMGDCINQLVEQGLTKREAIKIVAQATSLTIRRLEEFALTAERIPIDQRGTSISWRGYMDIAGVNTRYAKNTKLGNRGPKET